jgi:DoxX-like protein
MRFNRTLWTVQAVLALVFVFSGGMKLVLPLDTFSGPIVLPGAFLRFIGTAELLGGLGLILPGALKIRTELTPIAAAGLVIIMIGATVLSVAAMGLVAGIPPAVVGTLAGLVAYGRSPMLTAAPSF